MLEKLKQYTLYALGLLVAAFAAIFYARGRKIENLESKLGQVIAEKELSKEVDAYEDQKQKANSAEEAYRSERDAWVHAASDGSTDDK